MNKAYDNDLSFYDDENDTRVLKGRPIDIESFSNRDLAFMLRAGPAACSDAAIEWIDVLEWAAEALDYSNNPCSLLFD